MSTVKEPVPAGFLLMDRSIIDGHDGRIYNSTESSRLIYDSAESSFVTHELAGGAAIGSRKAHFSSIAAVFKASDSFQRV